MQPKRRHFEEKGLKALKKETLGIKRLKEKKIWKKRSHDVRLKGFTTWRVGSRRYVRGWRNPWRARLSETHDVNILLFTTWICENQQLYKSLTITNWKNFWEEKGVPEDDFEQRKVLGKGFQHQKSEGPYLDYLIDN